MEIAGYKKNILSIKFDNLKEVLHESFQIYTNSKIESNESYNGLINLTNEILLNSN